MEFFRKDSSLSNDVFESMDAPGCGTLEEPCRPETVVEESSCVTSPMSEPAVCGMKAESREGSESLPVKAGNVDFSRYLILTLLYEHPFKSAQLCTYELCNAPMVLYNVMGAL